MLARHLLRSFGLLLLASLPLASPPARAEDGATRCPRTLSAWVVAGGFGDGEEWSVRLLTLRGDRARLEELRVRSEVPKLAEGEARWFRTEARPEPQPVDVTVGTRVFREESLQAFCKELADAGIASLQSRTKIDEKKKPSGEMEEQRVEVTFTDERGGARIGVHLTPAPPAAASAKGGAPAAPTPRRRATMVLVEEDLSEEPGDEDEDGTPIPPLTPEAAKSRETSRLVVGAVRAVLDRNARALSGTANDFAGIPAVRRILGVLDEMDEDGLPADLPNDFLFEAATAPRDYSVALCVEAIVRDEDDDKASALRRLGDQASPAAVDDLVLLLQESPRTKDKQDLAVLALRALLKADPEQARVQAARLLGGSRPVARAALGVFAATETAFAKELDSLDLGDAKQVLAVTTRLKAHLAETSSDPALRKAAGGV